LNNKLTLAFTILFSVITACATAPVQEMSDARQTIHSAEEAGAARYSPQHLNQAQQLLKRAEVSLQAGAYYDARRFALDARDEAILAREKARFHEFNRD
jgi:predicted S18 family serine protease